jgi:hypothetical protein
MSNAIIGSPEQQSTERKSNLNFVRHSSFVPTRANGSGACPVCQTECGWQVGRKSVWCKGEDRKKVPAPQEGTSINGNKYAWIQKRDQSEMWKGFITYQFAETIEKGSETPAQREERLALAAYNKRQADKERTYALKQLPSNEARDAYYRSVLRPLQGADIEDLIRRGLTTDEILNAETLGFIGRGPRQTSRDRNFLILSHFKGAIVGGQIATANADRKYIWDNHEFTTHLQGIGSAPHMECASIKLIPNTAATTIVVVEGFLKALVTAVFAAREGLDWYVMGVAGSSFLGGVTLANRIAELKAEFPGIKVTIAPDGDMATNEHVYKAYKPQVTESSHYDGVLWFGQSIKGQNVDDVSAERRASAQVISVAKYWAIIKGIQEGIKTAHIERYNNATEARKLWFGNTGLVLDKSACGSGKSYILRSVADQMDEEGLKITPTSKNYRNDEQLQGLTLIQGRHNGLVRENGNIRTIKLGEDLSKVEIVEPSNCFQAASIAAQTAKGMFGEGDTVRGTICVSCPLSKQCEKGSGQDDRGRGYGYNHGRKAIDNKNVHALHPQSLPGHGEADTSKYYLTDRHLAFDESESAFNRCFEDQVVTLNDLKTLSIGLPLDSPGQLAVRILNDLCAKAALSRYGLNMQDLQELLTIAPDSLNAIDNYIQVEQSYLNRLDYPTEAAYIEAINRIMVSNFTNLLRQIIAGSGTATANAEGLTLMVRSGWTLTVGNANSVILDATGDAEELSAAFGGVTVTEVMSQMNNITPKIVKIGGSKNTSNRSEATRATNTLITGELAATHKDKDQGIAIADSGRFLEDYADIEAVKLKMHVDNVGSNKAKDCNALVIVGLPRPNITAYKARWEILVQNSYKRDFEYYYKMKCAQLLHQTIHRLRPNRRPNEELTVYILDGSYDGPCDAEMTVEQILADKATGKSKKIALITNVLETYESNGKDGKVSLRKIGELTGTSHTNVATLLPQAIALMSALRLDEVIESLHAAGVESEEELTAIINEIILSAIGAMDNEDELGEGEVMTYEYIPEDGLITA